MVVKYINKKIQQKLHLSFFTRAPHGKTAIFILQDSIHNFNFDAIEEFANSHFHIINISDLQPWTLDDINSYLTCLGAHYGFCSCVLNFICPRIVTLGCPCHFRNFDYFNQQGGKQLWYDTIDFHKDFNTNDD